MSEERIWFLYTQKGQEGPYTEQELLDWLKTGAITNDWYVWREGFKDWQKIADTPELLKQPVPPPFTKPRTEQATPIQTTSQPSFGDKEPETTHKASRSSMVWAIVALVLGGLGLLSPAIFAWLIGGTGIIFGVIGIIKEKERARTLSIVATVVCAFVIMFSFRQCAKVGEAFGPTKALKKGPFYISEQVEFKNQTLTITSVQKAWQSSNEFSQPRSGKEYLLVYISIENISKQTISFNAWDFKIRDSQGVESSTTSAPDIPSELSAGSLSPGGRVSGNILFEITSGEICPKLIFAPGLSKEGTEIHLCERVGGS